MEGCIAVGAADRRSVLLYEAELFEVALEAEADCTAPVLQDTRTATARLLGVEAAVNMIDGRRCQEWAIMS